VSIKSTPWSIAARTVAIASDSSVPPHIQPPMAQVPKATRDALRPTKEIWACSIFFSKHFV
jgi:hypothetical protein